MSFASFLALHDMDGMGNMSDMPAGHVMNHDSMNHESWWHQVIHWVTGLFTSPTSIFSPQATPAHTIFGLSMLVLAITLTIFLTVGGLLLYTIIRFRHRAGDQGEPSQVYGSKQIEVLWTVIPVLILVVLFLATIRVISVTERTKKPANALDVVVIGHQYWWEYRYPASGVVTANELHIPASDPKSPTPTYMTMSSADVDHSFWVPNLAGKMDLIPNKVNVMWMDPRKPGIYLGQCAQYCGMEHAKMLIRVYVDSPADFAKWIAHQKSAATEDPKVAEGKMTFEHTACVNCHTLSGTSAKGKFGPDLTHLASRETLASGIIPNTPQNLRQWLNDPDSIKPGSLMPKMNLSSKELDAITAYMASLR
jgi:cytochrome c oxidase subunit 2